MPENTRYIRKFETLTNEDVPLVGGKNASLGEMIRELKEEGIRIPDGFATTADAYRTFLKKGELTEQIETTLEQILTDEITIREAGKSIRSTILETEIPEEIADAIRSGYRELSHRYDQEEIDVAVRSSATAEDLPTASFAGQQETYLNVRGQKDLLEACRKCFASLFTDRAITYRREKGFDHMEVALSVGIQKMVRSDRGGAGVMFTIETESGFPDVLVINAGWGLGETVVAGSINPDEYMVYKPLLHKTDVRPIIEKQCGEKSKKIIYGPEGDSTREVETPEEEQNRLVLNDDQILKLARWGSRIEEHYDRPMDIEWGLDGDDDQLYILQARPETVQSGKQKDTFMTYNLKEQPDPIVSGRAIGDSIASGPVSIIESTDQMEEFVEGSILVTHMTQPDWVPIMKQSKGIITDEGGRTCHAAIVSRELGVPAIVGTGNGTDLLKQEDKITLSCAEGETGHVYPGIIPFEAVEIDPGDIPKTKTRVMMNMASPEAAFRWWRLPVDGIGLARMEFIINDTIKIHPMALAHFDRVNTPETRNKIEELTARFDDKKEYFVHHLSEGIARIAASRYPDPVIVRMSDFKSNEYAKLIGGDEFEIKEDNPMLGVRGASRYERPLYRDGFTLECEAIKRVRNTIGLNNVIIMIPFCRTPEEADRVLKLLEDNGLRRGEQDLQIYMMAEIPSNILLAEQFAERFDGFSIGSNDLTQLVLGVDRDSAELADLYDERNQAVKRIIHMLIRELHAANRKVGICGQAPSDYPDFATFLVREQIDSISLNPDSVVRTKKHIAEAEQQLEQH